MLAKQKTSHNSLRNLSQKTDKKPEKLQRKKLRKIVPIFAIFCHISQQKNDSYPKLPIIITKQLEQLL